MSTASETPTITASTTLYTSVSHWLSRSRNLFLTFHLNYTSLNNNDFTARRAVITTDAFDRADEFLPTHYLAEHGVFAVLILLASCVEKRGGGGPLQGVEFSQWL